MSKTKAAAKAKPKKPAAKTKTKTKPKVEPFHFKKEERITYLMCKKMDPCWEGLSWWTKCFGKSRPMVLDTAEVPSWFEKYIPAVSFDFNWTAWFLRQLIEKMVDQMNIDYERYGKECKRLYAVHKVFEREATKAARENTLSQVTMQARVAAAIMLCQMMVVTYKKL